MLRRNACSGICHGDARRVVLQRAMVAAAFLRKLCILAGAAPFPPVLLRANHDLSTRRSEFQSIVQQVRYDVLKFRTIKAEAGQAAVRQELTGDAALFKTDRPVLHDLSDALVDVPWFPAQFKFA